MPAKRLKIAMVVLGLILAPAGIAQAAEFPNDSGFVNVRDFSAKGDGHTDDTAALQAAINAAGPNTGAFFWRTKIVYLPTGTYRVSRTLQRRYAGGKFGSGMILVGESASVTVIQLAD